MIRCEFVVYITTVITERFCALLAMPIGVGFLTARARRVDVIWRRVLSNHIQQLVDDKIVAFNAIQR